MDLWYNFNKALRPLYGKGLSMVPGKEKEETVEPVDSAHKNIIDECSGPIGTANLYCKRK